MKKKTAKKKSRTTASTRSAKSTRKTAAASKKAATRRSSSKTAKKSTAKRRKTATAKGSASTKRSTGAAVRSAKKSAGSSRRSKVASAKRTPVLSKTTGDASIKRARGENRRTKAVGAKPRPRSAPTPTSLDPVPFPEELRKLPKTRLDVRQLRAFKELLLHKRAVLVGDVERLTDGALHRGADGQADTSSMPIHMADIGSDTWEQDFTLGLIASEQSIVREIDDALRRIQDRTYGVCLATHGRITVARLRAKPWAKYCIEYARAREDGRAG